MRSRTLIWINFFFATLVVVGVFLQTYFIAAYFSGAGEGALDAHAVTGGIVVHGAELLVFLSALIGYWRVWRWVGWSFLLLLIGTVQIFLSPPDEDPLSGWVHGLHGLLALFVLVIASVIAHHGLKVLRRTEPALVSGPPAP